MVLWFCIALHQNFGPLRALKYDYYFSRGSAAVHAYSVVPMWFQLSVTIYAHVDAARWRSVVHRTLAMQRPPATKLRTAPDCGTIGLIRWSIRQWYMTAAGNLSLEGRPRQKEVNTAWKSPCLCLSKITSRFFTSGLTRPRSIFSLPHDIFLQETMWLCSRTFPVIQLRYLLLELGLRLHLWLPSWLRLWLRLRLGLELAG